MMKPLHDGRNYDGHFPSIWAGTTNSNPGYKWWWYEHQVGGKLKQVFWDSNRSVESDEEFMVWIQELLNQL